MSSEHGAFTESMFYTAQLTCKNYRDHNMQCRLMNARICDPESPLRILHKVNTNEPVENFPTSLAAIQDISMLLYCFHLVYNIY